MACLRLGSKSESFRLDGNNWFCSTGLPSDVVIDVGDMSFNLHKFPLLSRSGILADLIGESSLRGDGQNCTIPLHDMPGGHKTFLQVAKFCYGVKIEINASNVVALRCAAEYLQMTDDFGEENLVTQTEHFLDEVFTTWVDSIKALEACEEVLPLSEEVHVVSRCITSLAMKACTDPTLFSWPVGSDVKSPDGSIMWNGIRTRKANAFTEDWWYEDVSFLRLSFYKRLILAVEERGMSPERIAGSIIHYTKRHLPLMGRQSGNENGSSSMPRPSALSESDQTVLLEEIVELLPHRIGVAPTKFLLRLLRTSMILQVGTSCQQKLERRIGSQLDQALLEDILIPSVYYSSETLYNIDCVQRMLDHFMSEYHDSINPVAGFLEDDVQALGVSSQSPTPMTMVASLIDGYLAEVATDANLKLQKFQALAAVIPDYARPLDDGLYRAVDIYLKAHSWLTDSEREQICRLINCQKLSMEACTHAAQNERLPLRLVVQVLFFEQLRLRTSIAGWFYVSDNLEGQSQNPRLALTRTTEISSQGNNNNDPSQNDDGVALDDMKERIMELEKECLSMKQDLRKLVKDKGGWNVFFRRLGSRLKPKDTEHRPGGPRKTNMKKNAAAETNAEVENGTSLPELPISLHPIPECSTELKFPVEVED